jgi:transcriptional regulator with XRE-family HTH domain
MASKYVYCCLILKKMHEATMRVDQQLTLAPKQLGQSAEIAQCLVSLRLARHVRQGEAAVRAGLSRATAQRIEKGDPGVAIGALLRYLDAIAPGMTLLQLLNGDDPAIFALERRSRPQRVRELSKVEMKALDF